MNHEKAYDLICNSLHSLQRAGVVTDSIVVSADAVILGAGSELDSLGFVSFVSDLEERLSVEAGEEIYLILSDIHDFNGDKSSLTLGTLAGFIVTMTAAPVQ